MGLLMTDETIRFYITKELEVVEDPALGDEWIEVKARLPYYEYRAYMKKINRYTSYDSKGNVKLKDEVFDLDKELLQKVIVAWSEDAEITPENIDRLPNKVITQLLTKIKKLYGFASTATEEEESAE